MGSIAQYQAIDPIATILHGDALRIWYLIHHPNDPFDKSMAEVLRRTTAEERQEITARIKVVTEYATAVQRLMPK